MLKRPIGSNREKKLFRKIQSGMYTVPSNADGDRLSGEARDLLQSLLNVD